MRPALRAFRAFHQRARSRWSLPTRRDRYWAFHSPLRVESLPLVRQRPRPQKDCPRLGEGIGVVRSEQQITNQQSILPRIDRNTREAERGKVAVEREDVSNPPTPREDGT